MLSTMLINLRTISERVLSEAELQVIGGHGALTWNAITISVEGPLVRLQGEAGITPEECERALRICEEVERRHGRFYLLRVSGMHTPPLGPDQRRLVAEWSCEHAPSGIALVTPPGSFMRPMTLLLLRTIKMLSRRSFPLAFFRKEAEARTWLASLQPPAGLLVNG